MSGIAGIVYPDLFQVNHLVSPMLKIMSHRGSEQHTHAYKNLVIGCCGEKVAHHPHQPIYLVFDGIITNKKKIHKEILELGHNYPLSDRATIIYAYKIWGSEFLQKIEGDFSFALFDERSQDLYLVRDRIGKKPLYWYRDSQHFLFATELKSILATGIVSQTPAIDSLSSYMILGFIPQDMSPIKGVNKLLPSHVLHFNLNGSSSIHSYWSHGNYFYNSKTKKELFDPSKFEQLMKEAIQSRTEQNQHVGSFLSGGIGSSTVAYYLKDQLEHCNLTSYTVNFQKENDEDLHAAQSVSNTLGIKNSSQVITPDSLLSEIIPITWHLDEPLADPNIVATWSLSQLASHSSESVFSGMGSDELLAGHSRYLPQDHPISYLQSMQEWLKPFFYQTLLPSLKALNRTAALFFLKRYQTNPWQVQYISKYSLFKACELYKIAPKLFSSFDPEVFLQRFHHLPFIESKISSLQYFDIKTRLPDCFILQYEKLTAAQQTVWHTPFLDENVIKYLSMLPEPDILNAEGTIPHLQKLFANRFPRSVTDRPKASRKQFLHNWMQTPELQEIFPLLIDGSLTDEGIINKGWLTKQVNQSSKNPSLFPKLWGILILEIWFRLFINKKISKPSPETTVKELLSYKI